MTSPQTEELNKYIQKERMAEWMLRLEKKNEATDFESKTSALVDEGVRTLRNWDEEVPSIRILEEKEARLKKKDEENLRAQARKEFTNQMATKIKPVMDPKDHITPRVVISEFEKYMEKKKVEKEENSQKRVQFDPNPSPLEKNYGFDPPNQKNGQMPKSKLNKKGSKRDTNSADAKNKLGRGGKTPLENDPAWWRRKIRQGMIQTEMLMSELSKQRREDEKYFKTVTPFIHGIEIYNPMNPFNAGRNARIERERLERSMKASRKLHEDCFGSCPVPNSASLPSARGMKNPKPSLNPTMDKSSYFFDFEDEPTSATDLMTKNFPRVAGGLVGMPQMGERIERPKPSVVVEGKKGGGRMDDVKVLYSRDPPPPTTARDEFLKSKTVTHNNQSNAPVKPIQNQNASVGTNIKQDVKIQVKETKKPIIIVNQERPKEWVQQIMDVKNAHFGKNQTAAQKKAEQQKKATNALYKELVFNKTRLEREVNFEKKQMAMDWRLKQQIPNTHLHHNNLSSDSDDELTQDLDRQRGAKGHRAKSSRSPHKDDEKPKEKKKFQVEVPRWKETPKGLNMWLENVMEKAKDEKEKLKQDNLSNKNRMVPLSTLRF